MDERLKFIGIFLGIMLCIGAVVLGVTLLALALFSPAVATLVVFGVLFGPPFIVYLWWSADLYAKSR